MTLWFRYSASKLSKASKNVHVVKDDVHSTFLQYTKIKWPNQVIISLQFIRKFYMFITALTFIQFPWHQNG